MMTVLCLYLTLFLSLPFYDTVYMYCFLSNASFFLSCSLLVTICGLPLSLLEVNCLSRWYVLDKWRKYSSSFVTLSVPLSLIKTSSNWFVLLVLLHFGSIGRWNFLTLMSQLFSFTGWTFSCFVRQSYKLEIMNYK